MYFVSPLFQNVSYFPFPVAYIPVAENSIPTQKLGTETVYVQITRYMIL